MEITKLRGRSIVLRQSRGPALASVNPISFLGGVDPNTGLIIKRGHDLKDRNVKGRILCFCPDMSGKKPKPGDRCHDDQLREGGLLRSYPK